MKSLLVLMLLSSLVSCSKIKELEDRTENMETTMEDMEKTTGEMKDTTEEMNETMDNMNQNMSDMYYQVRQKESSDTRDKELRNLRDEYTDMGAKLTAAKKFFYAFEYQLWTGNGDDTEEFRHTLIEDALEEFYRFMADFHDGFSRTSPIDINKANVKTKAFYALATTMHFNNDKQITRAKKIDGMTLISIYDVIKNALEKYTAGTELNSYEQVVVRGGNYYITEDLLNARMNFITVLGIKDIVSKDKMGTMDKVHGFLFKYISKKLGRLSLDSNYEVQNRYTQADATEKLDGALKTRKIIIENDLRLKMDKSIKSIIKNLKHPARQDDGTQNEEDTEVYDMLDELIGKK